MAQSEKNPFQHSQKQPTWRPSESAVSKEELQRAAEPKLESLGFSWDSDVEDVHPIVGTLMPLFMKSFPNPHKLVYVTAVPEPMQLLHFLRVSLESWPLFRSIAVEPDGGTPVVVILRPSPEYLGRAISIHDEVPDERALMEISPAGNHAASELPRDLLFRITIAKVAESKTAGFVLLASHAIMDAHTIIAWCHDVVTLIAKGSMMPKVPYRSFADIFQAYSTSLPAKQAAEFHKKRLQGIGSKRRALWPPMKNSNTIARCMPLQSFWAHLRSILQLARTSPTSAYDRGNTRKTGKEAIEGGGYSNAQYTHTTQFPDLPSLHSKHGVRASTIFKTAVSLYNVQKTGASHAIFGIALSGRAWPFLDESLAAFLPSAWKIAGPTFTSALEIVRVDWDETFEQLLRRVDAEQRQLNRHQHIPPDFPDQLSLRDRAVWLLGHRQFYNWQPNETAAQKSGPADAIMRLILDRDYKVDEKGDGFVWECGLNDEQSARVRILYSPYNFSEKEVAAMASEMFDIAKWLCNVSNWDKKVQEGRRSFALGQQGKQGSRAPRASLCSKT